MPTGFPYNVEDLVEKVKVICSFPNSSALLSDEEIIRFLGEEQENEIIPMINSLRAEYFVVTEDIPLTTTSSEFELPFRSVGCKLRDICLVDTNGNEIYLPQLAPEQLKMNGGQWGFFPVFPALFGYYYQYNKVKLYFGPPGNVSFNMFPTLRFKYYRKPNFLTEIGGNVTSFPAPNQLTLDAVPTTWQTGTLIDIIAKDPIFVSKVDSAEIASISMNTVTFVDDLPEDIAIGDHVCDAWYTTVPQLPVEAFNILVELVALRVFSVIADVPGYQTSEIKLVGLKKAFLNEFSPRTEGTVIKINSYNTIFDSGF